MASTKSRSPRKGTKDAAQDEAPVIANTAPLLASKQKQGNNMSEQSIIEFSEDISNAEAPAPLPKGDYSAEIRGAEIKTSAKGNKYGAVTFFIDPSQYPHDFTEGDPDGMTMTYNRAPGGVDTPAGRYRMRKFLESIGAKVGKTVDVNDWVGLTATVTVDHDTYEGETRAQIARVVAA